MRNIINISLPEVTVKKVRSDVKKGNFASTSEFFRHLLRLWYRRQLREELEGDRVSFERGEGKVLRSLKDLR